MGVLPGLAAAQQAKFGTRLQPRNILWPKHLGRLSVKTLETVQAPS